MNSTLQSADVATPPEEAPASASEFTGGGRLSRLDLGASVMHHKRLASLLFLLIFLGGLPVAYFKGTAVYSTQAVVYISPHFTRNAQGVEQFQLQSDPAYREYVKQNVRTIRRLDIAQEALKRLAEKDRRSWRRAREDDWHAAERLAGALIISPAPETYQVNVSLRGDRPEGLAEVLNTLLDVYVSVQKAEEFYGVESRLAALRQDLDRVGKQLSDDEQRRTQLAQAAGVGAFSESHAHAPLLSGAKYQEGLALSRRIEQARKQQASMEEQRRSLELVSRVPGSIRVFAKAQPAGLVTKSRRISLTLVFILAGLVIALLVPVALDLADPRVLVPSDAGRALGFDPLGWLPEREEGGDEFTWELLMRLANRIDEERQAHGARVWMFTSVKSGGGTTTLVNSLGRALTMLGVPTLSVEANAYRADGRFAGDSAGPGLTMLLRGHSTLSESIVMADREMPDHIPVGELDGRGRLPDIHRVMEILGEASESYALVLVDIPPLLLSVDSEYLARRSDCVVLVAEARRVTSPELKRAARVLKRVQSKNVACILNRVHGADGGGFAQDAKREFETGASKPMPAWQQPWLWK
jgi:Mrp family chromosome partitioning ATPase